MARLKLVGASCVIPRFQPSDEIFLSLSSTSATENLECYLQNLPDRLLVRLEACMPTAESIVLSKRIFGSIFQKRLQSIWLKEPITNSDWCSHFLENLGGCKSLEEIKLVLDGDCQNEVQVINCAAKVRKVVLDIWNPDAELCSVIEDLLEKGEKLKFYI